MRLNLILFSYMLHILNIHLGPLLMVSNLIICQHYYTHVISDIKFWNIWQHVTFLKIKSNIGSWSSISQLFMKNSFRKIVAFTNIKKKIKIVISIYQMRYIFCKYVLIHYFSQIILTKRLISSFMSQSSLSFIQGHVFFFNSRMLYKMVIYLHQMIYLF